MENEAKILSIVKDMADTLENVAANHFHTPYLYSMFLRALLAAKTDNANGSGPASPRPQFSTSNTDTAYTPAITNTAQQLPSGFSQATQGLGLYHGLGEMAYSGFGMDYENPFTTDMGSMGPPPLPMPMSNGQGTAPLGTFAPPNGGMQPSNSGNNGNNTQNANSMVSVDSILSTGFWDSMLVPGKYLELCVPRKTDTSLLRLF